MISRAAADAALDLLLAPRCAGCGAAGSWLCLGCRELCEPVRHGQVTAAGTYGGALREAIHRFKYGGERALANELGALVAARVASDLAIGVALDVVVPAVLHRDRARSRGYDQAALLAAVVAERAALPLRIPLRRIRHGAPHARHTRAGQVASSGRSTSRPGKVAKWGPGNRAVSMCQTSPGFLPSADPGSLASGSRMASRSKK